MIRKARDGRHNFVREHVGGGRVTLSDIFELLF